MKWQEFIQSKQIYEQVWKNLKADYSGEILKFLKKSDIEIFYGGLVVKALFSGVDLVRGTILDPDKENSIWEKISSTLIRLKPKIIVKKDVIREIVKGDFDRIWLILQQAHGRCGQMSFGASDLAEVAINNSDFFIQNTHSDLLLDLAKEYRLIEKSNPEDAKKIYSKMKKINFDNVSVFDYQVEIIFPSINMEFIQELKQSKWVDKTRISMSRASIKVILKSDSTECL